MNIVKKKKRGGGVDTRQKDNKALLHEKDCNFFIKPFKKNQYTCIYVYIYNDNG